MNKSVLPLLLSCLAFTAHAQQPTAAPTPEQAMQMQAAMARQMQMMSVMFDLKKSKLGFDETVNAIRAGAQKRGWKLGDTQDMGAAMKEAGAKDAARMKVISLCPAGAAEKVAKAGAGKVPALPCRATVFDGKDKKVYVMRMNLANVAKTLQGDVAKAMAEVAAEEEALYKDFTE
ncbi:MAG: DUF302 domain-containing protein [Betaproteobacteria bacterium]|nr:DUF302 domain-containing protein [Betaproteobacteria bacterium]